MVFLAFLQIFFFPLPCLSFHFFLPFPSPPSLETHKHTSHTTSLRYSVAKPCLTLCDSMGCNSARLSRPSPSPRVCSNSCPLTNHLILCRPLPLLSVFPSIKVFSNESAVHIRWPKYWSFNFSISSSNECSGLISSMFDCFDLLDVQGTLKSLLQHHS